MTEYTNFTFTAPDQIQHNDYPRFIAKVQGDEIKVVEWLDKTHHKTAQQVAALMRNMGDWYTKAKKDMASIFSDSTILTTPALLRLASVKRHNHLPPVTDFENHRRAVLYRLWNLISDYPEPLEDICEMIVDLLGQDALIECNSMTEHQVAEAILTSSAGIGLLADLRENWKEKRELLVGGSGQDTDFYDTLTLREWLETLAAQYIDI